MKKFYEDNYNKITIFFWVVFIFLLWLQYIYLSTLIEASLFLIVLIPAIIIAYILANVWLPKAIHKKKMKTFTLQFLGTTLLNTCLISGSFQLIRLAEIKGYFPHSILLADDHSLITEFLFALPSNLLVNFGSCGLRFYYENIKLQKVNLEVQLQMLQSQINPHFMFNVLNHIHILMQTHVELASSLLLQYAEMLRFQLYRGKCDKIRLEEEVLFLKNFVEIERIRWGDQLKVDCNCSVTNKDMEIPPLLLIPFIENAFKYASRTIRQQGFVEIELKQENAGFTLVVRNSKSTISSPRNTAASGIGLANTRKRLDLLFNGNHRLFIREEETLYHLELEVWQN